MISDILDDYIVTRDLESIARLPRYIQITLELFVTQDLNNDKTMGRRLNPEILRLYNFLSPFTDGYLPKIKNVASTCWVSTSLWFVGSMRLLINSTREIMDPNIHPIINFMTERMKVVNDPNEREWAAKTRLDFSTCIVKPSEHRLGVQDDAGTNIDDIIELIVPDIKDKILYNLQESTSRNIILKSGKEAKKSQLVKGLKSYALQFNKERKNLINFFEEEVAENEDLSARIELFNEILLSELDERGDTIIRAASYWPKMYKALTGKSNPKISSFERFCGHTSDYTLVNPIVCKMENILKQYSAMLSAMKDSGTSLKPKEYQLHLQIPNYLVSIQQLVDSYLSNIAQEIRSSFDKFEVVYTKVISHHILNVSYIIINMKYESVWDPELEEMVVTYPEMVISDKLKIGKDTYILTALAMKSGGIDAGHWWAEIRKSIYSRSFIEYNDLDNDNITPIRKDLSKSVPPRLLCYTLLPKILPK